MMRDTVEQRESRRAAIVQHATGLLLSALFGGVYAVLDVLGVL